MRNRAFRQCLADVGIKQSQSRAGKCTDNAVTERFFHSLKTENLYRENYAAKTAHCLVLRSISRIFIIRNGLILHWVTYHR
ncbi:DDE-type integrase/transposase/recombinase [Aggregatibacter actinomycetemcomitans]|nr:DDE-type integrase/transposase/recombinase [Aggregatibacter actinomycetemcomitans]TYA48536.1 DDE-type integrase/transposase/recombinase [Aggregatibacter actinomycetemcomitans]